VDEDLLGLILDDTALAFIVDERATRSSTTVAAEEASVMNIVSGATCEAASKEKSRRYKEADDSSPGETEGIAADGGRHTIGIKDISGFDKLNAMIVSRKQ